MPPNRARIDYVCVQAHCLAYQWQDGKLALLDRDHLSPFAWSRSFSFFDSPNCRIAAPIMYLMHALASFSAIKFQLVNEKWNYLTWRWSSFISSSVTSSWLSSSPSAALVAISSTILKNKTEFKLKYPTSKIEILPAYMLWQNLLRSWASFQNLNPHLRNHQQFIKVRHPRIPNDRLSDFHHYLEPATAID